MAENATAVNDAPITEATDSAPVQTSEQPEDLDSFDLDASDFEPSEPAEEESTDTDKEDTQQDADTTESEQTEDTETEEADKPEDTKLTKEEKRQQVIRNLVNERNELRKSIAELNAKFYEARTAEQIEEQDGLSPELAEIKAMREERELERYNEQVVEAQLMVQTDAQNVIEDFSWADENSKDFNKELAPQVDQLLANNLIRDPNTEQIDANGNRIPGTGQIIGQHLPTYQLYKLVNDAMELGKTNGHFAGQKAIKKTLANADTPSSGSPKESKKDAFADAFDKEFDRF